MTLLVMLPLPNLILGMFLFGVYADTGNPTWVTWGVINIVISFILGVVSFLRSK